MFKKMITAAIVATALASAAHAETMSPREKAIFTATLTTYQETCPGRMPGAGALWINMHKDTLHQKCTTDLASGLVGESVKIFGGTKAWCSKIKVKIINGLDG